MRQRGEHFEFRAAGKLWSVPGSLHPALALLQNSRAFGLMELAAALANTSVKDDLIKSLGVLAGVVLVEKNSQATR